jgi:hypothetical protein
VDNVIPPRNPVRPGVSAPVLASTARLLPLLLPLWALACVDRITLPDDETADTEGPAPGEAFSGCMDKADCDDDWCLHPTNEPGFCTYTCAANGVDACEPSPGGTATVTCLTVQGDQVCALDCAGNKSCPPHMRCEQIEANNQARSICF